jgi:hypothetical protein
MPTFWRNVLPHSSGSKSFLQAACFSKSLVHTYHTILHHNPEGLHLTLKIISIFIQRFILCSRVVITSNLSCFLYKIYLVYYADKDGIARVISFTTTSHACNIQDQSKAELKIPCSLTF